MVKPNNLDFNTLSLHAGQRPDSETGSRAVPIYQTSSYMFENVDHAASLFNLETSGHIYSRISNPTVAVLEERLASLEGGIGSVCTASGLAAINLAILTLMDSGSHIVSSSAIYGGTYNLFAHTLPRFGIETSFVNPRDLNSIEESIKPNTRLIYGETIGNPGLEILNIPEVAKIAHSNDVPLMIDSTFTTPFLSKPFDYGADIVMHSVTKFLGGHGIAIGGVVIDNGKFNWQNSKKYPTLTEPYLGYHGLNFSEEFGPAAFIMRARAEGLRDFGACMSPSTAFLFLQGVETLTLRMKEHVKNTNIVAKFLKDHPQVTWVNYPSLENHPDYLLAKELLPNGAGAIICFGIKGGREAGKIFIEKLKIFSHLANVGDAKSLVIHPASTTHQQMDSEALINSGITDDLVRLSIGLEHSNDLLNDLDQALHASKKIN